MLACLFDVSNPPPPCEYNHVTHTIMIQVYSIYSIKYIYIYILFLTIWQERGKLLTQEKGFSENSEQLYNVM